MKKVLIGYHKWILILSIVGIGLASYLFYEYSTQATYGVCNINSVLNCDPVTTGALAELWGIPVSLIGLVGYIAILISAFFKKYKVSFAMATFGMLFCLRLTILEIFVENVLCLVCLACQIIMIVVFFLTYQTAWPEKVGLVEESQEKV